MIHELGSDGIGFSLPEQIGSIGECAFNLGFAEDVFGHDWNIFLRGLILVPWLGLGMRRRRLCLLFHEAEPRKWRYQVEPGNQNKRMPMIDSPSCWASRLPRRSSMSRSSA
jgi:hypothetical protein